MTKKISIFSTLPQFLNDEWLMTNDKKNPDFFHHASIFEWRMTNDERRKSNLLILIFFPNLNDEWRMTNGSSGKVPYENVSYENVPYENVPYENVSYENVPHENVSYENVPYENVPYENVSYENVPFDNVPSINALPPSHPKMSFSDDFRSYLFRICHLRKWLQISVTIISVTIILIIFRVACIVLTIDTWFV